MALSDLSVTYSGRADAPSASYPQGRMRNESSPGAEDGTLVDELWANDWQGFFAALLAAGGVSPSGSPDTAVASDYFNALGAYTQSLLGEPGVILNGQAGNTSGLVAMTNNPALATLDANTVAFIDGSNDQLKTYAFNGITWSQVGSSLTITGNNQPAIARLSATTIAYVDTGIGQLRTYSWNGSAWSLVGSGLTISGIGGISGLTALDATTVAHIDLTNSLLRTYSFNGSTWSLVGSGLSIGGLGNNIALAGLDSSTVALTSNTLNQLRTYTFNGSTWSQTGNSLTVVTSGTTSLAAFNSTTVAFCGNGASEIRVYTWDGTNWINTGDTVGTPGIGSAYVALTALDGANLAFADSVSDALRKYGGYAIWKRS